MLQQLTQGLLISFVRYVTIYMAACTNINYSDMFSILIDVHVVDCLRCSNQLVAIYLQKKQ